MKKLLLLLYLNETRICHKKENKRPLSDGSLLRYNPNAKKKQSLGVYYRNTYYSYDV